MIVIAILFVDYQLPPNTRQQRQKLKVFIFLIARAISLEEINLVFGQYTALGEGKKSQNENMNPVEQFWKVSD